MIRYDVLGKSIDGTASRSSMFSECDELNPVEYGSSLVPVPADITYNTYDIDGNESSNEYTEGTVTVGRMSKTFTITASLKRSSMITAVGFSLAEEVPSFCVTLKCLAIDGQSWIDLGTVNAGYEAGTTASTTCCFSSYNPSRNSFKRKGRVIMRFFNASCSSTEYRIVISANGNASNDKFTINGIWLYDGNSFVSPIVTFALANSDAVISANGRCDNVKFQYGCAVFSSTSYISLPSVFLFGLEDYTMSFSILLDESSEGAVVSKGTWYSLAVHDGKMILTCGNSSSECIMNAGWHRITAVKYGSAHTVFIDGEDGKMTVESSLNPFFHSSDDGMDFKEWSSSGLYFGTMTSMSMKQLRFYDHALSKSDIMREMTAIKK